MLKTLNKHLGANERVTDRDIDGLTISVASPPRSGGKETGGGRARRPLKPKPKIGDEIGRLSELADERTLQCALLQTLIDAAPDYFWVKDVDGAFVAANMALAADNGRANAGELIGLSGLRYPSARPGATFHDAEREVVRSGRAIAPSWNASTPRTE